MIFPRIMNCKATNFLFLRQHWSILIQSIVNCKIPFCTRFVTSRNARVWPFYNRSANVFYFFSRRGQREKNRWVRVAYFAMIHFVKEVRNLFFKSYVDKLLFGCYATDKAHLRHASEKQRHMRKDTSETSTWKRRHKIPPSSTELCNSLSL